MAMAPSLPAKYLLLASCALPAPCLDVPLSLYTGTDCRTVSDMTPRAAVNLSTCVVTPGLVSLRYDPVLCPGGGTVVPHLFRDAACAAEQTVLGFYRTGRDLRCLSGFASAGNGIAALMLGCERGKPGKPQATTTVSAAAPVVATGSAAPSMTPASSAAGDTPSDHGGIRRAWDGLGAGARIGIIAGGGLVVLALLAGLFVGLLKCIRPRKDRPPPPTTGDTRPRYPTDATASPHRPSGKTPSTGAPTHDPGLGWPGVSEEAPYRQVLDNVVQTARRHAASGYLDNSSAPAHHDASADAVDALPRGLLSVAFAKRDPDWRHKLGAAGELYMFEYLQSLRLPNFGLHNWKSSLRRLVAGYPGYEDIRPTRDAIADIEYFDEDGILTAMLLARGYAAGGLRSGMRPVYRFEVKSTMSADWRAPIHVSGKQEENIRAALIATSHPDQVYVLCRIFGLGRGSGTRLSIYLDPEALRRKGRLLFARDMAREDGSWIVRPV